MNDTIVLLKKIILAMNDLLLKFYGNDSIDAVVILYHGLGNGAGWVSTYANKPVIYFGNEKK